MESKKPEQPPLNTQGLKIDFGKHCGELVTRIPISYLNWAVSSNLTAPLKMQDGTLAFFCDVARAEILRRGKRIPDAEVSGHAIDRLSQKFLGLWRDDRSGNEGLMSWAQRITHELWEAYKAGRKQVVQDGNKVVIEYCETHWVIQTDLVIPVLLTVK